MSSNASLAANPISVSLSFLILGVVAGALLFSLSLGGPAASVPPAFIALGLVATALFTGRQVVRHLDGRQVHAEQRLLALAAGLLSPLILLSFFQEIRGRTGSSLVGIVSAAVHGLRQASPRNL